MGILERCNSSAALPGALDVLNCVLDALACTKLLCKLVVTTKDQIAQENFFMMFPATIGWESNAVLCGCRQLRVLQKIKL